MKRATKGQPKQLRDFHDPAAIIITTHAVERFRERHIRAGGTPITAERARGMIRERLGNAVEEVVPESIRVRRIMSNDFEGAEYWRHGGWRFVTGPKSGRVMLFTCERRKPEEN